MNADDYWLDSKYQREMDRIFTRDWLPVARVSELANRGSFKAVSVFGEQIVLIRQTDNRIKALSNVCRHRMALIAEGAGEARRLVCPYHSWTYDLDGRLIGAPCMEKSPDFRKAQLSLPEFPAEEWHGWVFVALAERPPSLHERLEPLSEMLTSGGVEKFVIARRLHYPAPWNWKLMVENFSESYHHIAVHPQTLNPYWPGQDTYGVATNGAYSELRHPDHPEAGTFTVYTVFPYLIFAIQSNAPVIFWLHLNIHGPTDMELEMIILADEQYAANESAMDAHAAAIDAINKEDFPILAAVQKGVASRAAMQGPLSSLEEPISTFHSYLQGVLS